MTRQDLHDALIDLAGDLPSPPDDLTLWHLRQALVREMRKDGETSMEDQQAQYEMLYELPDAYLFIDREADQGWNYALYDRAELCSYGLVDGGYIDGRVDAPIDDIAAAAARMMGIDDVPRPADKTFQEFSELVETKPDAVIRSVEVYLSPELKKAGIAAIPEDVMADVREQIDQRFLRPILLIHDPVKGFGMHQIDPDSAPDSQPFEVELPDCTGRLYVDRSAGDAQIGDYDVDWARQIWLDPVCIDRIGGKIVFDID